MRPTAMPFWAKCLNRFHFSLVTTLPTQISFVSIGHRGSTCIQSVPDVSFHFQRASHPEECRSSTHAAYPLHCYPNVALWATLSLVRERTSCPPVYHSRPSASLRQTASRPSYMKQVSERLGPRPPEICRAYDRLEDWEDCRPSKDASRPGTRDHNHSPFSTGITDKWQGCGCPVLFVRP